MQATTFEQPTIRQRLTVFFGSFDRLFIYSLAALCVMGLLIMYSAGYDHGTRFYDHARNILLAFTIAIVVSQFSPNQLSKVAPPLYFLGFFLLLAVEFFGVTKKGATRWISLGVTDIQPSEIMKVAVPLMLAWWFQFREGRLQHSDFFIAAGILMAPVGLIMLQPDLGTSLLVMAAGLSIIYFAGLSWKIIIPPIVLGAAMIPLLIIFEPTLCEQGVDWVVLHEYQRQRVCTLLDPMKDPLGKGFHIIQGMIAIGSGGLLGKGFMQGTQTHLEFIPERTTDFIFTTYAEEFGLLGTTVLLIAFLFLIFRALTIAYNGATLFARLLAGSMAVIYFTYAFVNIAMVSGILPVVGVPLPFISYGGTAMVTLGLATGILLSISRTKQLMQS